MVFEQIVKTVGTQPTSEQQLYIMDSNNVFAVNAGSLPLVFTSGITKMDEKAFMEAANNATALPSETQH